LDRFLFSGRINCFTFYRILFSFIGIVPYLPSEHQMSSSWISLIAITKLIRSGGTFASRAI